jgi:hypothetical protein
MEPEAERLGRIGGDQATIRILPAKRRCMRATVPNRHRISSRLRPGGKGFKRRAKAGVREAKRLRYRAKMSSGGWMTLFTPR